jgi:hypothetical protein
MHLLFKKEEAVLDALRGIPAIDGICNSLQADSD